MLTGPQSEHWNAVCLLLCVEEVEFRFDGHLRWHPMEMIRLTLRGFPQMTYMSFCVEDSQLFAAGKQSGT